MPGFRISAADIVWQPAARAWPQLDQQVAGHVSDIDGSLGSYVRCEKDWQQINLLLDERLFIRPGDVMDSRRPS
jgi:hypothetical protein